MWNYPYRYTWHSIAISYKSEFSFILKNLPIRYKNMIIILFGRDFNYQSEYLTNRQLKQILFTIFPLGGKIKIFETNYTPQKKFLFTEYQLPGSPKTAAISTWMDLYFIWKLEKLMNISKTVRDRVMEEHKKWLLSNSRVVNPTIYMASHLKAETVRRWK